MNKFLVCALVISITSPIAATEYTEYLEHLKQHMGPLSDFPIEKTKNPQTDTILIKKQKIMGVIPTIVPNMWYMMRLETIPKGYFINTFDEDGTIITISAPKACTAIIFSQAYLNGLRQPEEVAFPLVEEQKDLVSWPE